ncbi:MAG TPA: protein kinase, partial [Nocardioides sp.]|nr:protein kinase [Nocardioides sp.]
MALNGTHLVHACGAEYEADAVFCPGCWQPVAAAAVPVAARAATAVICPHCDRETPPGERCVRCLDLLVPAGDTSEPDDEWQRVNLPAPLRDRYTFLRELSSGGQADVLICSDNNDHDRLVVVKIYRPGTSLEDAALDELRAGATDRSYVVPIHDFGRTGGVAWEVQEYVPGGSLADVFKRSAPFADLGVALRLTRQLWAAITYLHERHLIHRDLKPSNVLV